MNLRIGSGMQQARRLRAEQAVEAVRNREDGTGDRSLATPVPKGGNSSDGTPREWTPEDDRWRGGESHERKAGSPAWGDGWYALEGSKSETGERSPVVRVLCSTLCVRTWGSGSADQDRKPLRIRPVTVKIERGAVSHTRLRLDCGIDGLFGRIKTDPAPCTL
jgi:hypothetical protein